MEMSRARGWSVVAAGLVACFGAACGSGKRKGEWTDAIERNAYDFVWRSSLSVPLTSPPVSGQATVDELMEIAGKLQQMMWTLAREYPDSSLFGAEVFVCPESFGYAEVIVITMSPLREKDRALLHYIDVEGQRLFENAIGFNHDIGEKPINR